MAADMYNESAKCCQSHGHSSGGNNDFYEDRRALMIIGGKLVMQTSVNNNPDGITAAYLRYRDFSEDEIALLLPQYTCPNVSVELLTPKAAKPKPTPVTVIYICTL